MSRKTTEDDQERATAALPLVPGQPLEDDVADQPGLKPTEILILDLLASGPLDPETLFTRAEPSIWGHHVTLAAVAAGFQDDDDYRLMVLGKRPAFEHALKSLRVKRLVRLERGGLLTLKGARRGLVVDADGELVPYVPGTQVRETTRWQINSNVREMSKARPELLEQLSPRMSEEDFALLVESMRAEGFDPLFRITIDSLTGKVVDGHQRLRAATAAGVSPLFRKVRFESDAERVRFIARANLHRRNISPRQRARAEKALLQLGASMADVTGIIGRPHIKRRTSNAIFDSHPHEPRELMEDGGDVAETTHRFNGMSEQTRQYVVALLQGIHDRSPSSMEEIRDARREVAGEVAHRLNKSVGTIMNPVVRKAGHSSADAFDRLTLDWLKGDGSALLASILGSDPAKWDPEDASVLEELLSGSGRSGRQVEDQAPGRDMVDLG